MNRIILLILAVALIAAGIPAYAQETTQLPAGQDMAVADEPETLPTEEPQEESGTQPPKTPIGQEKEEELPEAGNTPEVSPALPSPPPVLETAEPQPQAEENTEELSIMPLTIATDGLDANEVMVDNFADLKTVLEDYSAYAGVDTIYLNGDITYLAGGIAVNTNRNALTIIGHPKGEGGQYTITDIAGGAPGNAIRILKNNFNLTIRDININGKNYYGPFVVYDGYTGCTISYENVTYNGPQITYNRRGIARYIDCSITIAGTGGDPAQEVAELAQLEIGGNTTFTNTAGATSMFWFAGNFGSNQYLKVLDGAQVTVSHNSTASPYGFIYVEGLGAAVNQRPEITIGQNASLAVSTRVGFTHIDHRVESIEIKQGGKLSIMQTSDPGNYPTVHLNSSLTVQDGGTLEVQRAANTRASGLIRIYNTGGRVTLNNPKRIRLYNPYGRVVTARTGTATISGTVGAINAWTTDKGYTDSVDNMPANIWNKNDSSAMSMSATLGTAAVTAASISNQAEGDPFTAEFNSATFNTYAMPMLVMGSYFLDTDEVYPNDTAISGTADSAADIRAGYTNGGIQQALSATADGSGKYSMAIPDSPIAPDTEITAMSHRNYLKARHVTKVLEQPSILRFLAVPDDLAFATANISALPQTVGRQDAGWTIAVEDTRGTGSRFRVDASIAQPLLGVGGTTTYTLPDALVYVDGTGQRPTLGNVPVTVYDGTTGTSARTDINWAADKGLLVSLSGGEGQPGIPYSTTVEWSLIDAP